MLIIILVMELVICLTWRARIGFIALCFIEMHIYVSAQEMYVLRVLACM